LIAATQACTGLRVQAGLDRRSYPLGVKVSDRELAVVPLHRHDWHGEWTTPCTPRRRVNRTGNQPCRAGTP